MQSRRHAPTTRRAAEILLRATSLPMARIATELGLPASTVRAWNRGGPFRVGDRSAGRDRTGVLAEPALAAAARTTEDPPNRAWLEAALRRHIARQIVILDSRLDVPAPGGLDSARILRDLGGLKRLLDDLAEPAAPAAAPSGGFGEDELVAMRQDVVRRYAAFAGREGAGLVDASSESGL